MNRTITLYSEQRNGWRYDKTVDIEVPSKPCTCRRCTDGQDDNIAIDRFHDDGGPITEVGA